MSICCKPAATLGLSAGQLFDLQQHTKKHAETGDIILKPLRLKPFENLQGAPNAISDMAMAPETHVMGGDLFMGTPLLNGVAGASAHEQAISHLNARGFVQFHPLLAAKLESHKCAIVLGHMLYWTKHLAITQAHRRGWFFLTSRQLQDATGLTAREQVSVRQQLVSAGLIEEALAGKPAKLHYKLKTQKLAQLLDVNSVEQLSWELFAKLFQPSIRFYKPLADITGSTGAGLYLSYLLQRMRFCFQGQQSPFLSKGEFLVNSQAAGIALGLGPKAQRNARDKLKAAGLVQESRSHHDQTAVRINLAAILACVQVQADGKKAMVSRKPKPPKFAPMKLETIEPSSVANNDSIDAQGVTQVPTGASHKANRQATGAAVNNHTLAAQSTPVKPTRLSASQKQFNLFGPAMVTSGSVTSKAPLQPSPLRPSDEVISMFAGIRLKPDAGSVDAVKPIRLSATKPFELATTTVADKTDEFAQNAKLEFALLSKLERPFVETNLPFCRNIQGIKQGIKQPTTTARDPNPVDNFSGESEDASRRSRDFEASEHPQTATEQPTAADQEGGSRATQNALEMPAKLPALYHAGIHKALALTKPASRQMLLDELAGQLELETKTINNPVGWLFGLVKRFNAGNAVLAFADSVRAEREEKARNLALVQEARERVLVQPVKTSPVSDQSEVQSAVAKEAREKLRQLSAQWKVPKGNI